MFLLFKNELISKNEFKNLSSFHDKDFKTNVPSNRELMLRVMGWEEMDSLIHNGRKCT